MFKTLVHITCSSSCRILFTSMGSIPKNQQISRVEQIQRKAARYVFNDYRDRSPDAVTNMIDTLKWDSHACRRTKASLILLYKINGGLVEVPTTIISQSDIRTRGTHKFRLIKICISFLFSLIQSMFGTV